MPREIDLTKYAKRSASGGVHPKNQWGMFLPIDFPDFYDYIDDGIKDLVKVLIDLGLTTVDSCEGHSDPKIGPTRKYVTVAFKNADAPDRMLFQTLMRLMIKDGIEFERIATGVFRLDTLETFPLSIVVQFEKDREENYKKAVEFLQAYLSEQKK